MSYRPINKQENAPQTPTRVQPSLNSNEDKLAPQASSWSLCSVLGNLFTFGLFGKCFGDSCCSCAPANCCKKDDQNSDAPFDSSVDPSQESYRALPQDLNSVDQGPERQHLSSASTGSSNNTSSATVSATVTLVSDPVTASLSRPANTEDSSYLDSFKSTTSVDHYASLLSQQLSQRNIGGGTNTGGNLNPPPPTNLSASNSKLTVDDDNKDVDDVRKDGKHDESKGDKTPLGSVTSRSGAMMPETPTGKIGSVVPDLQPQLTGSSSSAASSSSLSSMTMSMHGQI